MRARSRAPSSRGGRRGAIPGQNSPEQVGQLIAEEYALLYETSPPAMAAAGLLRGAGRRRCATRMRTSPTGSAIARLLQESYRELRLALASANV